mmetsp:Transcript_6823/g.18926  ORF Transcript_6823/g.18926 Transcript_6823/m.18926 type:complete len:204 (+) Transcript_6823:406-1017(+)
MVLSKCASTNRSTPKSFRSSSTASSMASLSHIRSASKHTTPSMGDVAWRTAAILGDASPNSSRCTIPTGTSFVAASRAQIHAASTSCCTPTAASNFSPALCGCGDGVLKFASRTAALWDRAWTTAVSTRLATSDAANVRLATHLDPSAASTAARATAAAAASVRGAAGAGRAAGRGAGTDFPRFKASDLSLPASGDVDALAHG